MDRFLQDLRFGLRTLLRSPGVAAIAILSLGFGIGVNSSMFSVVNAVLLKPFPYVAPQELVAIWGRFLPSSGYDFSYFALSDPEAIDLMRETKALSAVAPYRWRIANLSVNDSEPERAWALQVPAELFSVLGVEPFLGRTFGPEEASRRASCTAVLSYNAWKDRHGASSAAVGSSMRVDGESCLVLGVMPESFFFLDRRVKLFLPLTLDPRPEGRASHSLGAVGRLAPGVSIQTARSEIEALMAGWAMELPEHHKGHFLILEPFHADRVRNERPALLVLMGAVGLVLLIVCSNVASLLLGRAESRRREMALRVALGASRFRLLRQLLTESLLLAVFGGGLGLLASAWTLDGVLALYPETLPGAGELRVDGAVLIFTLALTLGTVALFGLTPAISIVARRPKEAFGAEGRTSSGGPRRVTAHRLLVIAEVGLSLTLLVGAGLLLKSFTLLQQVALGFDPEGVLTLSINVSAGSHPDPRAVRQAYADLLERISAVTEVESAALISSLPLASGAPPDDFLVESRPPPSPGETATNADYLMVSPELFETLRIPLRRGRLLNSADVEGAPLVAVINETAARMYWQNEDPLGRRIRYSGEDTPWITIVGIVGDIRSTRLQWEPRPAVYVPHAQPSRGPSYDTEGKGENIRSLSLLVRAKRSPEDLSPSIRAAIHERDPNIPISSPMAMTEVVWRAGAAARFTSLVMSLFAGTALLLALVGVYGVVSYSVEQARQAIGIRMALGATTREILRLVVGQGALLGGGGIGLGLIASFLLSRSLRGLLYSVDPIDPLTFTALPTVLAMVVLLASYVPARRAVRVNLVETLRYQ